MTSTLWRELTATLEQMTAIVDSAAPRNSVIDPQQQYPWLTLAKCDAFLELDALFVGLAMQAGITITKPAVVPDERHRLGHTMLQIREWRRDGQFIYPDDWQRRMRALSLPMERLSACKAKAVAAYNPNATLSTAVLDTGVDVGSGLRHAAYFGAQAIETLKALPADATTVADMGMILRWSHELEAAASVLKLLPDYQQQVKRIGPLVAVGEWKERSYFGAVRYAVLSWRECLQGACQRGDKPIDPMFVLDNWGDIHPRISNKHGIDSHEAKLLVEQEFESKSGQHRSSRTCRLEIQSKVDGDHAVLDGTPYQISAKAAAFLQAAIDADGKSISMSDHCKSEHVNKLPSCIKELIEQKPGGGSCLKPATWQSA